MAIDRGPVPKPLSRVALNTADDLPYTDRLDLALARFRPSPTFGADKRRPPVKVEQRSFPLA